MVQNSLLYAHKLMQDTDRCGDLVQCQFMFMLDPFINFHLEEENLSVITYSLSADEVEM